MRVLLLTAASSFVVLASLAVAEARGGRVSGGLVAVRSSVRSDGTVVAAHYRTAPDGRLDNNLSYRGKSPLRGVIPQTDKTTSSAAGAPVQTAVTGVAAEGTLAPLEAMVTPEEPSVHRHHVACPTEKMVGGTDPYNVFCQIN
jgi:hypothetical protein